MSELRAVFDQDAETYDRARPRYPDALFDALVGTAGLRPDARLLEIGPGTGQATLPMAQRGYRITAIELGPSLAAFASRELGRFENVRIVAGAFEDVELPSATFDLVYAATAFHWLRPDVKYRKTHALLAPGGHLALIHTEHISDENGDAVFTAMQPIFDHYTPSRGDQGRRLPTVAELRPPALDTGRFVPVCFQVFPLTKRYTADQFTALRSTYSPYLALDAVRRRAFLDAIAAVVNDGFGGDVEYRFAITLAIARRVD